MRRLARILCAVLAIGCGACEQPNSSTSSPTAVRPLPAEGDVGAACASKNCIPENELPVEFRAMMVDRLPELVPVQLAVPPPISALTELERLPAGAMITIDTSPGCRGCEGDRIVIAETGSFTICLKSGGYFDSRTNEMVEVPCAEGTLPQEKIRELFRAFGAIGFFNITTQLLRDSCESSTTHKTSVKTTVNFDGYTHEVVHYRGCNMGRKSDLQLALADLETRVMDVVDRTAFRETFRD